MFHPLFWTRLNIKFCLKKNCWRRAEFLSKKCGRFVRYVTLEFDCTSAIIIQQCITVLNLLGENRQLQTLLLRPTACVVEWPVVANGRSNENETSVAYDRFLEAIKQVIRTATHLEHLSLGCLEDLLQHSDHLLALLSLHHRHSLSHLHLASVKDNPDHYPIPEIRLGILSVFDRLRTLSIDYDYVCDHLLLLLADRVAPLSQLVLHVHGLEDGYQKSIKDSSWARLVSSAPQLRVALILLHTCEPWTAVEGLLNPSMPLAEFRSYYCDAFRGEVLDHLWGRYAETLCTVAVVNALTEEEAVPQRTFSVRAESPVVMLAWRCHRLASLRLVGHEIADTDLIAVARLRGPQLKELHVPLDCVSEGGSGGPFYSELCPTDVKRLEAEVSTSLQRKWTLDAAQSPVEPERGAYRSYLKSLQLLQGCGSV